MAVFTGLFFLGPSDHDIFVDFLLRGDTACWPTVGNGAVDEEELDRKCAGVVLYDDRQRTDVGGRIAWAPNKHWLSGLFVSIAAIVVALPLPLYVALDILDRLPLFAEHLSRAYKVRCLQALERACATRSALDSSKFCCI